MTTTDHTAHSDVRTRLAKAMAVAKRARDTIDFVQMYGGDEGKVWLTSAEATAADLLRGEIKDDLSDQAAVLTAAAAWYGEFELADRRLSELTELFATAYGLRPELEDMSIQTIDAD